MEQLIKKNTVLKSLRILKAYYLREDFEQSAELKAIYQDYASSELQREISVGRRFGFIGAYVTEEGLYKHYMTSDGLTMIKKVEAIGCIDSYPMQIGQVKDGHFIQFFDRFVEKNKAGRQYIKDNKLTVVRN